MIEQDTKNFERVIGLDCHPDTFTAAVVRGQTPAEALTGQVFNKVPMAQLQSWAKKHTTAKDRLVLEAGFRISKPRSDATGFMPMKRRPSARPRCRLGFALTSVIMGSA